MTDGPLLETDRFVLRPLHVDDANQRYLSWFSDVGAGNIAAQKTTHNLDDLRSYVKVKAADPDVVFLGIFERDSLLHVGNVKFEPVDYERGYAVFGILIGDPSFRGRGVAGEVIAAVCRWLKDQGIRQILLGVNHSNAAAIRAYAKAGFRIGETPHLPAMPDVYHMILTL